MTETVVLDFLPEEDKIATDTRPETLVDDMLFSDEQWKRVVDLDFSDDQPIAITGTSPFIQSWPTAKIPIAFDEGVSECQRLSILEALHRIQHATCLQFPSGNFTNSLVFKSDKSLPCLASLGFQPTRSDDLVERNVVNLRASCAGVGNVMHLVLHALGMMHNINAPSAVGNFSVNPFNIDRSLYGVADASIAFAALQVSSAWSTAISEFPTVDFASLMSPDVCAMSATRFLGSADCADTVEIPGLDRKFAMKMLGNRHLLTTTDAKILNSMFACPQREISEATDSHFIPVTKNPDIAQTAVVECLLAALVPPETVAAEPGEGGSLAKNSQKKKLILAFSITGSILIAAAIAYFFSHRFRKVVDGEDEAPVSEQPAEPAEDEAEGEEEGEPQEAAPAEPQLPAEQQV